MRNKVLFLLLSIVLLFALASCEDVFYSGVSGRIYDVDNRNDGVGNMKVYAFTDKGERDKAYKAAEALLAANKEPVVSSLYRTTSDANGAWSIPKIIWTTSNSRWGRDYDSTNVYLIYFSQEYGLHKSTEPVGVVSSTTNQYAVVEYFKREMKTSVFTLRFNEEGTTNIMPDTMTFHYEYESGYGKRENDAIVNNGVIALTLNYVGDSTTLKLSDFKIPNDCWGTLPTEEIILVDEANINEPAIEVERLKYDFKGGISGTLSCLNKGELTKAIDGALLRVTYGGKEYTAVAGNADYSSSDVLRYSCGFSGLMDGADLPVSGGPVTIEVFESDGTTSLCAPVVKEVKDLYAIRNRLVIRVD